MSHIDDGGKRHSCQKWVSKPFHPICLFQNAYLAMRSLLIPVKTVGFDDRFRISIFIVLLEFL